MTGPENTPSRFARSLDAIEDLSHHTVRAYASDLRAFERFVGRGFETADLTLSHVVQFIEEMNRQGLERSRIEHCGCAGACCLPLVFAALTGRSGHGLVRSRPCAGSIRSASQRDLHPRRRHLTPPPASPSRHPRSHPDSTMEVIADQPIL